MKTTIQILGTGCGKCNKLAAVAQQAADKLGLDYTMEKVTQIARFADFGVIFTPALAINGKLKLSGRLPSPKEAEQLIAQSVT